MMLHIPNVLSTAEVADMRAKLAGAAWTDGRHTTGDQAATQKMNAQLPVFAPEAKELAETITTALQRHPLFQSAAMPRTLLTPRFNAYENGGYFGNHVDGAIHTDAVADPAHPIRVRTDVSVTVFLSGPEDYDGGELVVEDTYGAHEVKLPAGDAILYPSNQRPQGRASDARRAAGLVPVGAEPDPRRHPAPDAVRAGHDYRQAARPDRRYGGSGRPDQPLSQPAAAVG